MEREVILTGIGGQGIQLAAQVLARAAVRDGREVMMLGTYGGTMRGGNTDATVVVGDGPIDSPPVISSTWSVVAMHPHSWDSISARLRPGGVALRNASVFGEPVGQPVEQSDWEQFEVAAGDLATGLGAPMAGSMVMLGAFAGLTGMVGLAALDAALEESIPSYRTQHLEVNRKALRAGFEAVPEGAVPAWNGERAAGASS
ncbi:MAG: 2-oxoacid:acceptor oxidoreductase family protein [Myxococcota bacterium]